MIRIAVTGATGAMGRAIRGTADDRDDVALALLVSRSPSSTDGKIPVVHPDELADAFDQHDVDVLVDFTVPSASIAAVRSATVAGIAAVVGTTGFDAEQRAELREAAATGPVLVAPNFSKGVQALVSALDAALAGLADYDIEVTETHHNRKRDAPSGTAERLLEVIDEHRSNARRIHGRDGDSPRSRGEVGVHARRAGTITGEHEVLFAGNDEALTLAHRAESRSVFAAGALDAAVWIDGRSPGWYSFESVVST